MRVCMCVNLCKCLYMFMNMDIYLLTLTRPLLRVGMHARACCAVVVLGLKKLYVPVTRKVSATDDTK